MAVTISQVSIKSMSFYYIKLWLVSWIAKKKMKICLCVQRCVRHWLPTLYTSNVSTDPMRWTAVVRWCLGHQQHISVHRVIGSTQACPWPESTVGRWFANTVEAGRTGCLSVCQVSHIGLYVGIVLITNPLLLLFSLFTDCSF